MKNDKESGFISHLTELRSRIINSFIFLLIFFIVSYFFAEYLYGFLEIIANFVKKFAEEKLDFSSPSKERLKEGGYLVVNSTLKGNLKEGHRHMFYSLFEKTSRRGPILCFILF